MDGLSENMFGRFLFSAFCIVWMDWIFGDFFAAFFGRLLPVVISAFSIVLMFTPLCLQRDPGLC